VAWSTKMVFGWAHFFAIADKLRRRPMGWSPTLGRRSADKQSRYGAFRFGVIVWGGGTAVLWLTGAAVHLAGSDPVAWLPMLGFGLVYAVTVGRIVRSLWATQPLRRNLLRREGDPLPPIVRLPAPVQPAAAPSSLESVAGSDAVPTRSMPDAAERAV
jgi:hypothetical protein